MPVGTMQSLPVLCVQGKLPVEVQRVNAIYSMIEPTAFPRVHVELLRRPERDAAVFASHPFTHGR
jgi:hypothetical protein